MKYDWNELCRRENIKETLRAVVVIAPIPTAFSIIGLASGKDFLGATIFFGAIIVGAVVALRMMK